MSRNVLIVDDSATIRRMVRKTMDIAGLDYDQVYEASNGIEALAQLADHEVGVVVVDINMPTMNGVQLLQRMKQNSRLQDLPIVIASTEGSKQRIEQLVEYGACAYVRKPFQPEQLRDALMPILGVKENATAESGNTGDDFF
ncbi:MAG TPA: response regulator [Phycisphaerae bacterium]|nr:response regulator [Phycisphaerae bacterium]